MAEGTTYRLRRDGLEWLEVSGEVVALDAEASLYLGTNPSGALLWGVLAEGATWEELVGSLMEAYRLDREEARADVDGFLEALRAHDLLIED